MTHRIVVVEDNELNQDMLRRRLQRAGFEVTVAPDGQSGLEAVIRVLPDLVLMDMSLPILDGWEATRRLKRDPVVQHIPVIALTAHAMPEDQGKALDAGCDGYHPKPIDFQSLLGKMNALITRRLPAGEFARGD
jgi:two-component system cell cycle response regulator DivK